MATFTVQKGKRYKCRIELGFLESFVSNEDIGDRLVNAGFTDVDVVGEASEREATGTWRNADATAEMPSQITHVEEIEDV